MSLRVICRPMPALAFQRGLCVSRQYRNLEQLLHVASIMATKESYVRCAGNAPGPTQVANEKEAASPEKPDHFVEYGHRVGEVMHGRITDWDIRAVRRRWELHLFTLRRAWFPMDRHGRPIEMSKISKVYRNLALTWAQIDQ
jgi:hypothetical protein